MDLGVPAFSEQPRPSSRGCWCKAVRWHLRRSNCTGRPRRFPRRDRSTASVQSIPRDGIHRWGSARREPASSHAGKTRHIGHGAEKGSMGGHSAREPRHRVIHLPAIRKVGWSDQCRGGAAAREGFPMNGSATGSPGRFALPLAAERKGARSDVGREEQGGAAFLSHWESPLAFDFGLVALSRGSEVPRSPKSTTGVSCLLGINCGRPR